MRFSLLNFFPLLRRRRKPKKAGYLNNLSQDKVTRIVSDMNGIMETKQPFLKQGYSIGALADELSIPSYQLSALLNQKVGSNFNDYLNRFRIRYCIDLIHGGMAANLNLKGLSTRCGFNNRNSFSTAFKKFTGHTPSEYSRYYFKTGSSLVDDIKLS